MTTNETHIITNKNSVAQMIENDIVYIYFIKHTLSTKEDLIEALNAYDILTNNQPKRILFEAKPFAILESSARTYLEQTKIDAIAVAMVLTSLPQRILYNFYVNFRRQDHPIKAFKSKEMAIKWLSAM